MSSAREKPEAPKPPKGWRFDPFADAAMGKSLFEMSDEDWLVKDDRSILQEKQP